MSSDWQEQIVACIIVVLTPLPLFKPIWSFEETLSQGRFLRSWDRYRCWVRDECESPQMHNSKSFLQLSTSRQGAWSCGETICLEACPRSWGICRNLVSACFIRDKCIIAGLLINSLCSHSCTFKEQVDRDLPNGDRQTSTLRFVDRAQQYHGTSATRTCFHATWYVCTPNIIQLSMLFDVTDDTCLICLTVDW